MTRPAGLLISPIVPLTILVTSEELEFQYNSYFENMRNHVGGGLTFVDVFIYITVEAFRVRYFLN